MWMKNNIKCFNYLLCCFEYLPITFGVNLPINIVINTPVKNIYATYSHVMQNQIYVHTKHPHPSTINSKVIHTLIYLGDQIKTSDITIP